MLIQLLPLWGPILLCCAVVFLIRWTERRDWKAAQEEARVLMEITAARPVVTHRHGTTAAQSNQVSLPSTYTP